MATFSYSAYRKNGSLATGTMDAENQREAAARLKQQGLFPRDIAPLANKVAASPLSFLRRGVPLAELALMTRRLATLLESAVPLFEAITTLYEQEESPPLKKVLGRVRDRLAEGSNLARALADEPAVFSESYVSMVAAGEASGALELVLESLSEFLEDQQAVKTKVTTALAYPVLMLFVGSAVMLFLLAFVIPKIVTIFSDNKAALPFITIALIAVSNAVRRWWWLLLGSIILGLWGFNRLNRQEPFRLWRDRQLLRLPLFGHLLQQLILARFARVLGLLLKSGVPVIRALEITGAVTANREYQRYLGMVREELAEGGTLSGSLKADPLFPPLLVHMIAVGEKGGKLEEMLAKAGRSFEREFEAAVTRATALLEPLLVLGMGLGVGIVVVAVLLPIVQMNQLVK
jgi:general secretion pathway protein F